MRVVGRVLLCWRGSIWMGGRWADELCRFWITTSRSTRVMVFILRVSLVATSLRPSQTTLTKQRSKLVPPAPYKLGRRPGAPRQEDNQPARALHPSDLRLRPQARDVQEHGRADPQADPRRGPGHALGVDAEAGRRECADSSVAGERGAGQGEERAVKG